MSKSLEAIKQLKEHKEKINNHISIFDKIRIECIESSLKALEILKSHIAFLDKKDDKYYFYFEGGFGFECSKEEYDLLAKELDL